MILNFLEFSRWDDDTQLLTDSLLGETLVPLPIVHMKPELDFKRDPTKYVSPLYKTSVRAGVLSTTGESVFHFSFACCGLLALNMVPGAIVP